MKTKTKEQVLIIDLRETLKSIMQKELEKLPETLETLNPKDRLNIVCKLMPYVFPKLEGVNPKIGEPLEFDEWS
jgi:hypothetical protein